MPRFRFSLSRETLHNNYDTISEDKEIMFQIIAGRRGVFELWPFALCLVCNKRTSEQKEEAVLCGWT